MNRARRVAKLWVQARPAALAAKAQRQQARNARRAPKPKRDPTKI